MKSDLPERTFEFAKRIVKLPRVKLHARQLGVDISGVRISHLEDYLAGYDPERD